MSARRKLAAYALVVAAVLGGTAAAGAAAEPIGLANARPEPAEHEGMPEGMVPGLASAEDGFRLLAAKDVAPAGWSTYAFRIEDEDGAVTDFDLEHAKRMHLIVVRRDFVGFLHTHPTMAPDGTWTADLRLPEPGTYRVFADFTVDGRKHTLGTDLFVAGSSTPRPLPRRAVSADAGDGYTVELTGDPVAEDESELTFVVRRHGRVVDDIEQYLAARGHLVALRDGDLGYLHVHADEDELHFEAEFPTPGAYRLFLQFRHGGQVRTAEFTVHATEADR